MAPNAHRHRRLDPVGPTAVMLLLLPVWMAAVTADIDAAAHYTNQFAVRVASAGGDHGQQADRVARKHGFLNRGQVSSGFLFYTCFTISC